VRIEPKIYSLELSGDEIDILYRILSKTKSHIETNEGKDMFNEELNFSYDLMGEIEDMDT